MIRNPGKHTIRLVNDPRPGQTNCKKIGAKIITGFFLVNIAFSRVLLLIHKNIYLDRIKFQILYFLRNSFSLRFREKFSQIKTFSLKVFFMFCLDHFSLHCIIKMLNFKVNAPLNREHNDMIRCSNENDCRMLLPGFIFHMLYRTADCYLKQSKFEANYMMRLDVSLEWDCQIEPIPIVLISSGPPLSRLRLARVRIRNFLF